MSPYLKNLTARLLFEEIDNLKFNGYHAYKGLIKQHIEWVKWVRQNPGKGVSPNNQTL